MFAPEARESQPSDALRVGARADPEEVEAEVERAPATAPNDRDDHKLERAFAPTGLAEPAAPAPSPRVEVPQQRPPRAVLRSRQPSPAVVGVAWVVTLVLLGCFVAAIVVMRADVVKAWPATERAYRALGLV